MFNSCGTVRPNRKYFPKNLASCKMKQGDLAVKFCNGMTAMCWKDKRQIADLKLATLPSCLCKVENLTLPPVAKMVRQDLQMRERNFQLGPESAERKGNFAKWQVAVADRILEVTSVQVSAVSRYSSANSADCSVSELLKEFKLLHQEVKELPP
ncbi:hypothetical protein TNCT_254051 [Trichonephila clavata]|uniref:PiggyBac transposable element-derived protein domain-containing protein n=1 Tax=Trichonephila clavata TaxID=2740835 RepID=A0A8X6EZY3_TRICU|nr:hypothetical protein TNCT_254051 [Trichonephila clavata]